MIMFLLIGLLCGTFSNNMAQSAFTSFIAVVIVFLFEHQIKESNHE